MILNSFLDKVKKIFIILLCVLYASHLTAQKKNKEYVQLSLSELQDKIKGGWAGQTLGCTYGGPTEFRYLGAMIHEHTPIPWSKHEVKKWYEAFPGLYDDVYVDLTFVEVFQKYGLDATVKDFTDMFKNTEFPLWHGNQQARYNLLNGLNGHQAGYWKNNPHADDLDFQIEADFAGLMCPGMPNSAAVICDTVGHIMSYGNGWYGGVYVAGMYSLAFVYNDVNKIVEEALTLIPKTSTFYQCMSDIIRWYQKYPDDWKKCWLELDRKWNNDKGCPDGIYTAFNIETPINAGYIIMGLLYGKGDFEKTLDISTRCGQDSDCNPASAGGILATMIGYNAIPEKFKETLTEVSDIPFSHTTYSLNTIYQIGFNHAKDVICRNGGKIDNGNAFILFQKPHAVRFEESFKDLTVSSKEDINKILPPTGTFDFIGNGIVVKGYIRGEYDYMYDANISVELNGKAIDSISLPFDARKRKNEIFFTYELPEGNNRINWIWTNPKKGVEVFITEVILYKQNKQ